MNKEKQPIDALSVLKHRSGLARTIQCLKAGKLTVGFIGGSITDARSGHNWPEPVTAWLVDRFPEAQIVVENAAIGATGSDLAVFRAQRDLIDRGCDLVFIEFAVNDGGVPTERSTRTREGLIRKLLAGEGRDLVLVYTFAQGMYEDMIKGRVPDSIQEFESIGEHYGIGSAWMGLRALNDVRRGFMRWEQWLPDGLHPQARGSLSYGQSVNEYLERELVTEPSLGTLPSGNELPAPQNAANWERAHQLPLTDLKTTGPWSIHRWPNVEWIDQVLMTTSPGASIQFEFEGRGIALGFDFGKKSADFGWRLDEGDWQTEKRDRPDWCSDQGWFRLSTLADDLERKNHQMDIEVIHPGEGGGTNFRLALVGIIP